MRRYDSSHERAREDPEALGDEAVPVVRAASRRGYRGPVLAAALTDHLEGYVSWDDQLAMIDDRIWSRLVFSTRHPFSWGTFTLWWIARRYLVPRDIRKR